MKQEDNIIFLDIDGVLNDNMINDYENNISRASLFVLKLLIKKYNARVVIISSHQRNGTVNIRKKIIKKLEEYKISDVDFINPNFEGKIKSTILSYRSIGIIDYLSKYPKSNYIILDDEYASEYEMLNLNHYKTEMFRGLKYGDFKNIKMGSQNIDKLSIEYKYRELGNYEKVTNDLVKVIKLVYNQKNI